MSVAYRTDAPHGDRLARLLASRETLKGPFETLGRQIMDRQGTQAFEVWAAGVLSLFDVNAGAGCLLSFWRASRELAPFLTPVDVADVAAQAALICREAGSQAAEAVIDAFTNLAALLREEFARNVWWRAFRLLAREAPHCVEALARQSHKVLLRGHEGAFMEFVETGLKVAPRNHAGQLAYFMIEDRFARRFVAGIGAGLSFTDMEAELTLILKALFGQTPQFQPIARDSNDAPCRSNLAGPVIRLPEIFPRRARDEARCLYIASALHAGAHLAFGNPRFPVRRFKPVQIALSTLVEDARIEALAIRRYPGLRSIWAPFHRASPQDGPMASALLARVARGLFDPDYRDPDALIEKGQSLFSSMSERLDDPAISLDIGTRLANDLAQRRIRFDARGHVIEPAYRDDGLGLWDFSDVDPEVSAEVEMMIDAVRIDRRESDEGPADGDAISADVGRARPASAGKDGVEVATYPEWDVAAARERADWTTVKAMPPILGDVRLFNRELERVGSLRGDIKRLVRSAKVGRAVRLKRQADGHDLDIDAAIDVAIARRLGEMPDMRIFRSTALLQRNFCVLVLIDISLSTREKLADGRTILDVQKLAVAMLAEALHSLDDPFALLAFSSAGRSDVRMHYVKGFAEPYDTDSEARLAGLSSSLSTRLGTALRHAGSEIRRVSSFRKLILVLSDGEPHDVDTDGETLEQDARRAVLQLRKQGIDTFGVMLDPSGAGCGPRIFGKGNTMPIRRLEDLPARLSELYFRLARR